MVMNVAAPRDPVWIYQCTVVVVLERPLILRRDVE